MTTILHFIYNNRVTCIALSNALYENDLLKWRIVHTSFPVYVESDAERAIRRRFCDAELH